MSKLNIKQNGIISICSAHEDVLNASFLFLKNNPKASIAIESTVQQVNQDGGYTGMTPKDYAKMVSDIAKKYDIKNDAYILGGDHLGPNTWTHLASIDAMNKSFELISEYVKAGYTKLHIDPSMPCKDDIIPLPIRVIAERTAQMVEVAEVTAKEIYGESNEVFYIVGTEVPPPGGAKSHESEVAVTPTDEVKETISLIKEYFEKYNISYAWDKVKAVVVQPGVEFGDDFVFPYKKGQASHLSKFIEGYPSIVYEAHSTDYQTEESLNSLFNDTFSILKVGPELTFAWREALYALDMIEKENPYITHKSNIRLVVEEEMIKNDKYWKPYYIGTEDEKAYKRVYSLSDRIRYYWSSPPIKKEVAKARVNFDKALSYSLISQYLPWVFKYRKDIEDNFIAENILVLSVYKVIEKYYNALKG